MSTRQQLLQQLADGRFHSGTELGQSLGISRAAINKAVNSLKSMGLELHSVSGKGYRWPQASDLLDRDRLAQEMIGLDPALTLHLHEEVDSTSAWLMEHAGSGPIHGHVCLAEVQSAGRGRRGREWQATPFSNLTLSMAWSFPDGPASISGLSLAAGVAVLRALSGLGLTGLGLKWPNDILHESHKVAGLLLDVRGESDGPTLVVLGLGLNVAMNPLQVAKIDQPWTDLVSITDSPLSRNRLAVAVIRELHKMFVAFGQTGLEGFRQEWLQGHVFHDQPVRLVNQEQEIHGRVTGIDDTGALQLVTPSGEELTVHSGEVSLRAG